MAKLKSNFETLTEQGILNGDIEIINSEKEGEKIIYSIENELEKYRFENKIRQFESEKNLSKVLLRN